MSKPKAYILVDRSASMRSMWDEVESSIQSFVDNLKYTKVTVVVFDSEDPFEIVIDNKKSPKIDLSNHSPRASTPLNDAIMNLYNYVDKKKPERASILIITDGAENCSREASRQDAKSYIDKWKASKYDVTTIGANFDNDQQSSAYGVSAQSSVKVKAGNMNAVMRSMATRAATYNTSGETVPIDTATKSMAWTD